MPVYMFPDLLDGISPELRRRMQGKSCFNFKKAESALLKNWPPSPAAARGAQIAKA